MSRETRAELESLVALLCDGGLGTAERDRMEFLLRDDPECRRFYLAYIDLHAGMTVHPGLAAAPLSSPEAVPSGPLKRRPRHSWLSRAGRPLARYGAVAAAAVLFGVLLAGFDHFRRADGPTPVPGDAVEPIGDSSVAVLTRAVEARWEDTGMPSTLGAALPVGRL